MSLVFFIVFFSAWRAVRDVEPALIHNALMLGASRGIGYLIAQSEGLFDSTGVFAGMAVLSLVTVCVSAVAGCIERWALRWKASAEIETQGSQRFP